MSGDRTSDDGRVQTGRESGRDGLGVPHAAEADTYGQADAGQGNWSDPGPAHPPPPASSDAAEDRRLGQGAEPRGGAGGPADRDVRKAPDEPARVPLPRRAPGAEPVLASGLSNYSPGSQYGNQSRYGTPAQYNDERMVAGELQNGDHPEDRPTPGDTGPAHPNG
jgi:hypothetical protein